MSETMDGSAPLPRDLGDGLILRRATVADAEALSMFNARIHGNQESGEPDEKIGIWTRDLVERPHPTYDVSDFTVVEDTTTGKIVSSLNLISQTWSYGGISFGVGRPELVGTDPAYRRKGLVRLQMEVIHGWSMERGEKVQAITGIPYYYRQFGYEMALNLGGGRVGYGPDVPKLKEDEDEPYVVCQAKETDLPFIAERYEQGAQRYLVACVRDEELWRYELLGRSEQGVNTRLLRIIETREGEPIGYLVHSPFLWGSTMACTQYELKPGVSWFAVTPTVIRYLWKTGEEYAKRDDKEHGAFAFGLGAEHPVYQVAGRDRMPRVWTPYAWYIRVPDLPDFLRHIMPVLNQRLAESFAAAYSGELTLNFYRGGLRLRFDEGRLTEVEEWQPPFAEAGKAAFPRLTFLQLLFGYRALDELEYAFADCFTKDDEARALLNLLFPKHASDVWPVS
ncbi:MAG: GNAT family N-acetyltransferase [Chloroflexota bacterium]|nr:GNAT family N-acetyltransferase [Chloroflexota bacterium]